MIRMEVRRDFSHNSKPGGSGDPIHFCSQYISIIGKWLILQLYAIEVPEPDLWGDLCSLKTALKRVNCKG